jgi:hypothetical protein
MRAASSFVSQRRDRRSVGVMSRLVETKTDVVRTYNMRTYGTTCPENTLSNLYAATCLLPQ